jgi:hypothetical protein
MIDPNRPSIKSLLDDMENRGKLPPWAWPGGYPIIYIDGHNEVLCPDCAQKELEEFVTLSAEDKEYFDKRDLPVDWMIHYEGPPEYCVECNKEIASAYGCEEEEETDEETE